MSLSKEQDVANSLNILRSSHMESAATDRQWMQLVSEYFCDGACSSESDSESGDVDDPDNVDSISESDRFSADSDDDKAVIDEVAVVMENHVADIVIDNNTRTELQKIHNYSCVNKSSKYSCKLNDGKPCVKVFSDEYILDLRTSMGSLPDYEKDLILLGKISATISNDKLTTHSKRKEQMPRKHQRTTYYIQGHRVCREAFKFLHCISQDKLTALLKHYKQFGLVPRYKKSGGRQATDVRLLTHADITEVVAFIVNFAEDHAMVLPGRVPRFNQFDIKLLPSNHTKASIWRKYNTAMEAAGKRAVKIDSFRRLWRTLVPYIRNTRPMTDLCWTCQKNNSAIYRSVNISDEKKSERLQNQQAHLNKVTLERSLYQEMVRAAKVVIKNQW
ncbi:uncharacterized protein LOC117405962 [Acipenser ruthenus]|uniref:uncharacterized protein LOC117405962 n=1 Tax=Acipenser ruthenus TaxID=7906 RepID=UPI0027405A00|nr:uncharacterized protein LOC117405962 [Acipenser ruthenus]